MVPPDNLINQVKLNVIILSYKRKLEVKKLFKINVAQKNLFKG